MDDQLISLEMQKAHYEDYIKANSDWEYAGLYYDEGITGTKKEVRPALLKMIADCEDGKIDYIITKSVSRFARNTADCLELVRKLLGLGIAVYFEKENLDTGLMESELLLSIMGSLAESESLSTSENLKWSIRKRFENGTFKFGYAPFGYAACDGTLIINEDEARWVRYIFAEILAGKSSNWIAKDLNEKRVPARKGYHWTATTVQGIVRNEKYIGDCLFQKTYKNFRFKKKVNHGEHDQFYMENHHEPIISREDFNAAKQMLHQHAKEKNIVKCDEKYRNRYPFSGKIICGECGSPFKRRFNINGTLRYPAWVCREHIRHKENCSMKFVRESVLEDAFATMMNKLIFGRKEILQDLLDAIRSQNHKVSLRRIKQIEDVLESMTERRQTLTAIMTKGYLDPAVFTKEMNSLRLETAVLEEERENLTKEINGDMRKTEELREILKFTGSGEMLSKFDPELFERFTDHITVCSKEEVIFHLKCGLSLRERIG